MKKLVFLSSVFAILFLGDYPLEAQPITVPSGIAGGIVQNRDSRAFPIQPRLRPLKTPWGKEVSPTNVHPDYPRPSMVRQNWLNLNGLWDWADGKSFPRLVFDAPKQSYQEILVPYPIESSLSGVGKSSDRIVYRRYFVIPEGWSKTDRIMLHFGAVDWEAVVFVNGRQVGGHQGGYDSFSFDVTDFLRDPKMGPNELIVQVFDPTNNGEQPRGKQTINPSGIWYAPVSGIWQTVWLEPVPTERIESAHFQSDPENGLVTVLPKIVNPRKELSLLVEAFDGAQLVAKVYGGTDGPLLLQFPKDAVKKWTPDQPQLYQIRIRLIDKEKTIDQIGSYCALRRVDIVKDGKNRPQIRLNGQPLFLMGVIDQGYWPDGLYTAPSDEAIQMDIRMAKKLGFNMIRKHVKVESERWYFWCDRLGVLVWQDMPSGENRQITAQDIFRNEMIRVIRSRHIHPSIVAWTLFNEGWGQHKTEEYTDLLRRIDPTRLVDSVSGWTDMGVGDVIDSHRFPGPEMPPSDLNRAAFIGSFGGLTLVPPKENLWSSETWGYQHVPDSDSLLARYRSMHDLLRKMIREQGLAGAVFHQLVDVETECNGLMTYDRVIIKVPPEEIEKTNRETIATTK